jgi:uncharacterized membrane protein
LPPAILERKAWPTAFKLFLLSFIMILAGMMLIMLAAALSGTLSTSGGLILFLGPIPIILGFGPYSLWVIAAAAIITIAAILLFLVRRKAV